jgi:hypothetical protein
MVTTIFFWAVNEIIIIKSIENSGRQIFAPLSDYLLGSEASGCYQKHPDRQILPFCFSEQS